MPDRFFELDASRFRIGRIERAIADQKVFIARTEERLKAARVNLTLLEATTVMAAKTHMLIEAAVSFSKDLQDVPDARQTREGLTPEPTTRALPLF